MADDKAAASAAVDQNEKAFQKQGNVFLGYKKLANKKVNKAGLRWTRNVGLGFKTPVTAIKVRPKLHLLLFLRLICLADADRPPIATDSQLVIYLHRSALTSLFCRAGHLH